MSELPPRQLAAYGLGLLVLVLLAAWYMARDGGPVAPAARAAPIRVSSDSAGGGGGSVVVHVEGAVRDPGVYRLREGSRVDDALRRAGGPRARADLSAVNLAAELEDGRQVLVPTRVSSPAAAPSAPGGPSLTPGVPLNLNTATPEQLDQLDGIGPATAQQIIKFREAHDGFGSVDELGQVPGIGEKRLATLREQVRV